MIFYHSNWHGSCFLSVYCKFVLSNKSLIPDRSGCFLNIFSERILCCKENTDELFYVWRSSTDMILVIKKKENFEVSKAWWMVSVSSWFCHRAECPVTWQQYMVLMDAASLGQLWALWIFGVVWSVGWIHCAIAASFRNFTLYLLYSLFQESWSSWSLHNINKH